MSALSPRQPFREFFDSLESDEEFAAFPLTPDSKVPLEGSNGLKDSTANRAIQARWAAQYPNANVGHIPESSGHCVVDIDGLSGEWSWLVLQLIHGFCATTLEIQTRKGRHLWFKGSLPASSGRLGPGIDTRGRGSYVVLSPSIVSGHEYKALNDCVPAPLPKWIGDKFCDPRETRTTAKRDLVAPDSPENVACFETFVRSLPPPSAGNRNDTAAKTIAPVANDFGVSAPLAIQRADELWNQRGDDPLSLEELTTAITSGHNSAQNDFGARAHKPLAETFKGIQLPAPGLLDSTSLTHILTCPTRPVQEIVPGLIEKGVATFLAGPGGSNKSRLGLQFGLCIAAGINVLGRPVEHCAFVYVSSEDPSDEVARRAQAIATMLHIPADKARGLYVDRQGKDSALVEMSEGGGFKLLPFYDQLVAALKAIPGHKVGVLDSCYDFVRFLGKAKIDEGAVNTFIKVVLQRLCDECDATIIVIWHPSQAGMERGDASGWSVAWHNAPRARLSLLPVKDTENAFELKVEKRNHGPKGSPVTLYWSSGALLPQSDVAVADRTKAFHDAVVRVAIDAAMSGQPLQQIRRVQGWQLKQIRDAAGYTPKQIDIKERLSYALQVTKELCYVQGDKYRLAGYYPRDPEQAQELAKAAKSTQKQGEDAGNG